MTAPFRVLTTTPLHPAAVEYLSGRCELVVSPDERPDTLRAQVADADALIVRVKLPDDIFDHAPRLKACVRHGVGLDFIPVEAATRAGIPVANLPTANSQAVVEHVLGVTILLARDLHRLATRFGEQGWRSRGGHTGGVELAGRTLGVVGCGTIGRGVAAAFRAALGMRVLGHNRSPIDPATGIEPATLERLVTESDVITLHVPSTPETRRMVGDRLLRLVKPGAILINASRGDLIDDDALVAALADGRLRGAALDVFEPEPLPDDHPFHRTPKLFLTPHVAGLTEDSARRMSVQSAEEAMRILQGERPTSLVNPEVWEDHLRRLQRSP